MSELCSRARRRRWVRASDVHVASRPCSRHHHLRLTPQGEGNIVPMATVWLWLEIEGRPGLPPPNPTRARCNVCLHFVPRKTVCDAMTAGPDDTLCLLFVVYRLGDQRSMRSPRLWNCPPFYLLYLRMRVTSELNSCACRTRSLPRSVKCVNV
jgi:hypothetical protein